MRDEKYPAKGYQNSYSYLLQVCEKREGETCGGVHQIEGQCGEGLKCITKQPWQTQNGWEDNAVSHPVGRCEYGKVDFSLLLRSTQN